MLSSPLQPRFSLFGGLAVLLLAGFGCDQTDTRNGTSHPTDTADGAPVALDAGTGSDETDGDTDDDPKPIPDIGRAADSEEEGPEVDVSPWEVGGPNSDADAPPLTLAALTPSSGPLDGGTKFVLRGEGFTDRTRVFFGPREANVELVNGELVGETPPGERTGAVTVKAKDPQTGASTLAEGYRYTAALSVDSVRPSRLPTSGGPVVTIEGRGFTPETRVSFDGKTAPHHQLVDGETIRAVAPPNGTGPADLRVTNRHDTKRLEDAVTYVETLEVDRIRPAVGTTGGGDDVTLHGNGFDSEMTVRFGGTKATVTSVKSSGEVATVTTPPHARGLVDVAVELPDGRSVSAEEAFFFRTTSTTFALAGVRPEHGTQRGGTRVTLIGAGLNAPGLAVTFADTPAAILSRGPGHAVVRTPRHSAGLVDVEATNEAGERSTLNDGFEYLRRLRIDRIRPASGDTSGGTSVTIRGAGFNGVDEVEFGSVPAQFTVKGHSRIVATTPSHAPGSVDVRISRGELETTREEGFRYTEPLSVYGISPARGSIAGNTYVLVRGRGFTGNDLSASFGGTAARDVEALDSQTLAVRTPPHPAGSVDVRVARDSASVEAPSRFHYFNPASTGGGTSGGSIEGSVNVSVYSESGGPIRDAFVMLSTNPDTPYTGRTDGNGLVTLSGPDVFGEQIVTVAARHFSSVTIQHVDATNITVILERRSRPTRPPPDAGPSDTSIPTSDVPDTERTDADTSRDDDGSIGPGPSDTSDDDERETGVPDTKPKGPPVFKGELTGLNKLGITGENEKHKAIVYTTKESPASRNPPPGPGNVLYQNGSYRIQTRVGDLALVAIGGHYHTETGEFEPKAMGVHRYQFAAKGKTYENRDIQLDIRLDETLRFKIQNPPFGRAGPDVNRVRPYLDFGFEGVFDELAVARGRSRLVEAPNYPPLEDELSDVELIADGGTYTVVGRDRLGYPMSVATKTGIKSLEKTIAMPPFLGVPVMKTPQPGNRLRNKYLKFDLTSLERADFYYVLIYDIGGTKFWEAFVPGSSTSVRFPTFPDFSHLPEHRRPRPYEPRELYRIRIYAARAPNMSLNSFSYQEISPYEWSAYAINIHSVEF